MPTPVYYSPDALVAELASCGRRLLSDFFDNYLDYDEVLKQAVGPNTLRSFKRQNPRAILKTWSLRHFGVCEIDELSAVYEQNLFDAVVDARTSVLARHWYEHAKCPLATGAGYKLVNLHHKYAVRNLRDDNARKRVATFLHVPHDEYCLAAISQAAASGRFGCMLRIPKGASMGYVESRDQYYVIQQLFRAIAASANVPPICIDLLAWDESHS